jgi:hypothetical protein
MTKRTNKNYPNDFKQEAVLLVTEQGNSVVEAAASLNITDKLLYNLPILIILITCLLLNKSYLSHVNAIEVVFSVFF